METAVCNACRIPKAPHICGLCQGSVCKKCAQFLTQDTFAFLENVPETLKHSIYCPSCFTAEVALPLSGYENTMARARAVFVFHRSHREKEQTRFYSRSEKPLKVENGADKDETLLRLAFLAASRGFNALLDVDVSPKKVRNFGYQTTAWEGVGVPTKVDGEALDRKDKKEKGR